MDRQGIPHIDQRFGTVALLRSLNNNDNLIDAVKINRKGQIVVGNSK
jgi:hypothetical protein